MWQIISDPGKVFAMNDIKIIVTVLVVIFGAIGGCYMFMFSHISKKNRHADAEKLVFKDVCEKTQDCFESKIDNLSENLNGLKEDMNHNFDEVKELIKES